MSHAKFSPSSAYRWLVCPASVSRSEPYPKTSSAAADKGTRLHDIAARALRTGAECTEPEVKSYVEIVRETYARLGGELLIEHEVIIAKDLCWGTLDAGILALNFLSTYADGVHVIDYKSGTDPVNAIDNPQLMLYTLGILRENPLPKKALVCMSIVQPNVKTGWPVKRYTPSVQTLLDFRGHVFKAMDKALAPNPPAVPGDHCYYCPAKMHCPEYLRERGAKRALL